MTLAEFSKLSARLQQAILRRPAEEMTSVLSFSVYISSILKGLQRAWSAVAGQAPSFSLETLDRVDAGVDGGRTMICVTDNGSGMSRDDLGRAITRHATSK